MPPEASSGEKKTTKKHGCAKTLRWCGVKKRKKKKRKKMRANQTASLRAKRATENDLGYNGLGTNPLGANRLGMNRLERNPME